MDLELISTRRCPFVQRSVITLNYKDIDYRLTFIDGDDPPDWFRKISPLGKVPVLRIDGGTVLFESAVINEYLDDITPGRLHPEDPLQRAQNRAWIEFGGECNGLAFQLLVAPTAEAYRQCVEQLHDNLRRVDAELRAGPYFNGADFALIDAAYAPLFIRLDVLRELIGLSIVDDLPKIEAWSATLLRMPAVQAARLPELPDELRALMNKRDSYAATLLQD